MSISQKTIEKFENNGVVVLCNLGEEYWLGRLAMAIGKALVW